MGVDEQIADEAERRVPGSSLAASAMTGAGVVITACITVMTESGRACLVLLVTLVVVARCLAAMLVYR